MTATVKPALAPAPEPEAAPARGFAGLPCLSCGEPDTVSARLADLTVFTCSECENEFTADAVEEALAAWRRVLDWIALAPALPAPE